jgi:hypothetical protein
MQRCSCWLCDGRLNLAGRGFGLFGRARTQDPVIGVDQHRQLLIRQPLAIWQCHFFSAVESGPLARI